MATKIYDIQLTEYILTKIILNTEVVDSVFFFKVPRCFRGF